MLEYREGGGILGTVSELADRSVLLAAEDLSKRYSADSPLAVDSFNVQVRSGEVYCLLGANGAGKTTAINLFLGFLNPSRGRATIRGIDVHENPLEAKRYVAYVPENVILYQDFTAIENLDYFATLGGQRRARNEYERILEQVGLERTAFRRRVKAFSKGMRQKLGIAIAIAKDAPVVLLDEPTTGLDPQAANDFMRILMELRSANRAIMMSTHDIFRVKHIADRMGIMKKGRLVAELTRQELMDQDMEALYLDYMGAED